MAQSNISTPGLFRAVLLASAAAALGNGILFLIGQSTGLLDSAVVIPSNNQPIGLGPVLLSSVLPVVAAGAFLWVLGRFAARPLKIFTLVSVGLLVLSLASPFMGIPGIPLGMALWLNLMHLVVAGAILYFFRRPSVTQPPRMERA